MVAQECTYTTEQPNEKWMQPEFDASGWSKSKGGLGAGNPAPPNAIIRSAWTTPEIWMRRTFELSEAPSKQAYLRIYHDEDCEVYINGVQVTSLGGYTTSYINIPISKNGGLKKGTNVIAVHCKQTGGGQFIDVGLFTAE